MAKMYQQARIVDEWGVGADGQGRSVLGGWVICLRLCRYYGIFLFNDHLFCHYLPSRTQNQNVHAGRKATDI